ncbi:MAG: DUF2585 family protein [Pyrinomonadaceae bacterium]
MPVNFRPPTRSRLAPWLACLAVVSVAALQLHHQGRLWVCACGRVRLWTSEAWGADTSQHLLDPYSLTHVLHGVLFCWLLAQCLPRLAARWRLCLAVALEAAWEVCENTEFVIRRYREATAALGYHGDTVINSLGDILCCAAGCLIALRLGLRRSLALFALVELMLLIWIRDSLLLEILMLLHPFAAIKAWQIGR